MLLGHQSILPGQACPQFQADVESLIIRIQPTQPGADAARQVISTHKGQAKQWPLAENQRTLVEEKFAKPTQPKYYANRVKNLQLNISEQPIVKTFGGLIVLGIRI